MTSIALIFGASLLGCQGRERQPHVSPSEPTAPLAPPTAPAPSPAASREAAALAPVAAALAPDHPVIAWSSASRGDSSSLIVTADGHARYEGTYPRPIDVTKRISTREVKALEALFAKHRICERDAPDRIRLPDEGTSVLALSFPNLQCRVQPDWNLEGAAECSSAIYTLIAKLQRP